MSVSQVKRQFEEMALYLNRDTEGQKRLKTLKDAVNVLRTSLATAVEEKEKADVIKDQARSRAAKAEAEMAEMAVQMQSMKTLIDNLRSENDRLMSEMDKLTTPLSDEDEDFFSKMKQDTPGRLMYDLRKALPKCPYFEHDREFHGKAGRFFVDNFFTTVTYQEVWAFGATVFLMTLMTKRIMVELRGEAEKSTIGGIFKDDRHRKIFLDWFGNNIYDDSAHSFEENLTYGLRRQIDLKLPRPINTNEDDLHTDTLFGSSDG